MRGAHVSPQWTAWRAVKVAVAISAFVVLVVILALLSVALGAVVFIETVGR